MDLNCRKEINLGWIQAMDHHRSNLVTGRCSVDSVQRRPTLIDIEEAPEDRDDGHLIEAFIHAFTTAETVSTHQTNTWCVAEKIPNPTTSPYKLRKRKQKVKYTD